MIYLKNNGKPTKFTLNEQTKIGYINKAGERKEVRIVMWRNDEESDKMAADLALPKNKKAILRFRIREDGKQIEEDDSRKDIDYSQMITNFPHIIKYTCGTSFKNEREYNIPVGEIAEIENEEDGDRILKSFHFVDKVNQRGELEDVICQSYGHKGEVVKGNPYRPLPSQRADVTKAPLNYEQVPEEAAPRGSSIDKRVTELVKGDAEEEDINEN